MTKRPLLCCIIGLATVALALGHMALRARSATTGPDLETASEQGVAAPRLTAPAAPTGPEQDLGRTLYEHWCESCHGAEGDGTGLGARYVYPPPRNLLQGQFSLATSANRIASREDIYRVIHDGMPGAAMAAHDSLQEHELQALVDEVCRLREAGARARYLEYCAQVGEEPDEAECLEYVQSQTTASETLAVPALTVPDAEAARRGQLLFEKHACASCHGSTGVGAPDVALEDARGEALRPRDLVHEPFKGGHQPESIYRRIQLGFPGGPMPAHEGLSARETADLVNYVISLSQEPKRTLTNHQLRRFAVPGLYLSELDDQTSATPPTAQPPHDRGSWAHDERPGGDEG